jgi:hypothetical protein
MGLVSPYPGETLGRSRKSVLVSRASVWSTEVVGNRFRRYTLVDVCYLHLWTVTRKGLCGCVENRPLSFGSANQNGEKASNPLEIVMNPAKASLGIKPS